WIVIDKDEAVEPQLKLLGQGLEVLRFRSPVDPARYNVLQSQRHLRASRKYLEDILFVIFAAQAKQHARCLLPEQKLLKYLARRINLDFARAVLSANPRP